MQEMNAQNCGREKDLVAFLYGELNDTEKKSFESHMHSCRLCQVQTSEFRSIRESVVAWRDESIGNASVTAPATSLFPNQDKVSALAALRAFFDLSPLWLKGAIAFAAMLLCVFSVLAMLQLRSAPAITTQEVNNKGYSQQDLNALLEERVQNELARRKASEQLPPASAQASIEVKNKLVRARSLHLLSLGNEVAANSRNGKARRPLSKAEREQLAADLRLVSPGSERGLDLTGDQINQY
jgi:hypothetical protein